MTQKQLNTMVKTLDDANGMISTMNNLTSRLNTLAKKLYSVYTEQVLMQTGPYGSDGLETITDKPEFICLFLCMDEIVDFCVRFHSDAVSVYNTYMDNMGYALITDEFDRRIMYKIESLPYPSISKKLEISIRSLYASVSKMINALSIFPYTQQFISQPNFFVNLLRIHEFITNTYHNISSKKGIQEMPEMLSDILIYSCVYSRMCFNSSAIRQLLGLSGGYGLQSSSIIIDDPLAIPKFMTECSKSEESPK